MSNGERTAVFTMLIDTVVALRQRLRTYLTYEVLFTILEVAVLGPVSALTGAYFISTTGYASVANERLLSYLFSVPGIASFVLWGTATVAIYWTEVAGLVIIAAGSLQGRTVSAWEAFVLAFRNLWRIVGVGLIQFLIYIGCCIPFLAVAWIAYRALLSTYDISYYITRWPPEFQWSLFIAFLLVLGLAVVTVALFTIWLLAVPVCLFEKKTLYAALKRSKELTRGAFVRIAVTVVVFLVFFLGLAAVITSLVGYLSVAVAESIEAFTGGPIVVASLLLAINWVVVTALSFLAFPLFAILITKTYAQRIHGETLSLPQLSAAAVDNRRERACAAISAHVVTWSIVAVILVSVGIIAFSIHHDLDLEDTVVVTAHRGSSSKAPENTLSSIRQAIKDGADYAEIDVQETSDGVVVLLHDSDFKRVAGLDKKIWETSYEETKSLDVGGWFSPKFAGERIPTLKEAIDTAKGKIKLNIELKYNGHDKRLAERVVAIVKEKQFEKDCILSSLKYDGLLEVKKLDADLRTGYMVVRSVGDLAALNVDCFCVESGLATASLIGRAQAVGKEVHVWTVDKVDKMEHFINLRVNGIITNYPDRLIEILRRRAAMSDAERIFLKAKNWLR